MNSTKNFRYRHLLVDWDGTIQLTLQIWFEAIVAELAKRKIVLESQVIIHQIIPHLRTSQEFGVTDIDLFIEGVLTTGLEHIPQSKIHLELWETLVELKKSGISQAVVSSSGSHAIGQSLAHHQLPERFFDHLVTRDIPELKNKNKPNPEPLHYALALLQGKPENAIILGDSNVDILAGHNAGIDTIWWYPPENEAFYNYDEMLTHKPTYVARTVADLQEILLK